jgi:hypothetical protein
MLHLACLESLASYFDYISFQIDYESLLNKVDRIRYSEQFKLILKGMIEKDEQSRFGLITLQETLGLASKRDTFPGSRSTSLAEILLFNQNKSGKMHSGRTYTHIESKKNMINNKEK